MKRLPTLLAALLVLAAAASCTMPFGGGPTPIPSPIVPAILTPVDPGVQPTAVFSPTGAPTTVPTNTVPPPTLAPSSTPTSAPSATPLSAGALVTTNPGEEVYKVRFPRSRTGVTLAGTLPANEAHTYLIRAQQDQSLIAEIFSPRNDLTLVLRTAEGGLLNPEQNDGGFFVWRLPSNQEYRLQVAGASQPSDYRLVVNIPRIVRFLAGSYGTITNGIAFEGETMIYRLRAEPGQTMTLELLNVPEGAAALGVIGLQSGQTALATEAGQMQWRGELPAGNTHYLVLVTGLAEGETHFSLSFDIR